MHHLLLHQGQTLKKMTHMPKHLYLIHIENLILVQENNLSIKI